MIDLVKSVYNEVYPSAQVIITKTEWNELRIEISIEPDGFKAASSHAEYADLEEVVLAYSKQRASSTLEDILS